IRHLSSSRTPTLGQRSMSRLMLYSRRESSENLSADSICKGVKVTLDNNSMWNEFYRCKTEMILTKQGSRMFPYCRFRISGLQPSSKYSLIMDIQPVDNSRYKWTGKSWQVAGKAESPVKSQPFAHLESPSTGQHWMQNPVSFYKLKLTNNPTDQEGNTILRPMHRYLPRLHVVQTDKAVKDIKLSGPSVVTFTFLQTEFMAVTAYQNSHFVQLKVDANPFAKGLKEDGNPWGLKLKSKSGKDSHSDEDRSVTVPEELSHREDSAASVFKWHTVLPPPERYIDTSFTTFQPTPQTPPFTPAVTPLLPSQTPVPQTLDTSTSTPSPHPAPSFQDNEQSLPFPGELSPLALQLPLSPTFSSLDGEGLSPTPSLTDLVHFFSNNDDLGIGLEFTNAETLAVSCPPPSAVEASTHEVSQVQPVPAKKHYRRKKKSRRRKLAKAGVDPKIHELAYTSMQPSLEEVEEQLFVSFTSKVLKCCISCL
uniref:T-box domain-containing protein n=1 Tax=Mola mola TaxID=94237 RepID=A0A3Q3XDY2_MOLML